MKVCFVLPSLAGGGAERAAVIILSALERHPSSAHAVSVQRRGRVFRSGVARRARHHRVEDRPGWPPPRARVVPPCRAARRGDAVHELLHHRGRRDHLRREVARRVQPEHADDRLPRGSGLFVATAVAPPAVCRTDAALLRSRQRCRRHVARDGRRSDEQLRHRRIEDSCAAQSRRHRARCGRGSGTDRRRESMPTRRSSPPPADSPA